MREPVQLFEILASHESWLVDYKKFKFFFRSILMTPSINSGINSLQGRSKKTKSAFLLTTSYFDVINCIFHFIENIYDSANQLNQQSK